jgi:hypothetical protein
VMSLLDAADFAGDWYGWITNQMSHALLGLLLYVAFCATWLAFFGEYPARIVAFLVVVGGFAFFEVAIQRGGMILDSIEDTAFTAYGAGALAVTFHEVTPGHAGFVGDIYSPLSVIFVFTLHSITGIAERAIRAWRDKKHDAQD